MGRSFSVPTRNAAWNDDDNLLRLPDPLPVRFPRELVGPQCFAALFQPDARLLLLPALIDRAQAPLGARFRRPDRFIPNQRENRIRMRRRQNAQRNPTAAIELRISWIALRILPSSHTNPVF